VTGARVMVDTDVIDRGVLAEVGAACAQAAAEVVPWRDAGAAADAPALLIGALRRGERRIPAGVLDAASRLAPSAGVLLMSDEPLVRPVVSTHGGRVTLLAQPASPARIRGTVRMLLAEHGAFRRERLEPHVWTAVLHTAGDDVPAPALVEDDGRAFTAVVPLVAGWSGAEALCAEAHALALARIDDDERFTRMSELLGHAAGMIHLVAGCAQWAAYWPAPACPLRLCSPLRLPRLCSLADAAAGQILHMTASPGDLVVALSHELPVAGAAGAEPSLTDGGAAFLDQLEARFAPTGEIPAGLVVEIR
jgi:hypothetical protein